VNDTTHAVQNLLDAMNVALLEQDPVVREARLGELEAALVARTCTRMEVLARKMLRRFPAVQRHEETADVVHDALLRLSAALREASVVRDLRSADQYFRLSTTQIRRQLLDLARRLQRRPQAAPVGRRDAESEVGPIGEGDSTLEPTALLAWQEFHDAVTELPDPERRAFELSWYEELSNVEIAALVGVDERTIRRRLQAASRQLFDRLGGHLPGA